MKICLVNSSNLPVEGTGVRKWGALELITDEYAKNFIKFGHEVELKYLNEVQPKQYDIVHIAVANLCLEAKKKGIDYIYGLHDHHSYYYGKGSWNYNQQLEAIKGSLFSIAPAEYVVDFFDETDKLIFLRHGADVNYYLPNYNLKLGHRLLMVANNGLAGSVEIDRKGMRFGVEAARELNLPITIAGADGTRGFFEHNKDLLEYDKLTLIDNNPAEDEILNLYQSHTIFVHPSFLEFGEPCLTLTQAASCCIPIVGTYKGSKHIYGMWTIPSISTKEVVRGIENTIARWDILRKEMFEVRESYDWELVCKNLLQKYEFVLQTKHNTSEVIKNQHIKAINSTLC